MLRQIAHLFVYALPSLVAIDKALQSCMNSLEFHFFNIIDKELRKLKNISVSMILLLSESEHQGGELFSHSAP